MKDEFIESFGSEKTGVSVVALAIVIFVTFLKLLGTQVLVTFNTLFLVISIFPSLVYMLWGLGYMEPDTWVCRIPCSHLIDRLSLSRKAWMSTGLCSFHGFSGSTVDFSGLCL